MTRFVKSEFFGGGPVTANVILLAYRQQEGVFKMGVDIYWSAVRYSTIKATEAQIVRELPLWQDVSADKLRDVCEHYIPVEHLRHVDNWKSETDDGYPNFFEDMRSWVFSEMLGGCEVDLVGWPTRFGIVDSYFPMWSFAQSGREGHDLRGYHAATTSLRRALARAGKSILSPREVHYRQSVFATWRSRPRLRGVSRRVDSFLNNVNKLLNTLCPEWEEDIANYLQLVYELRTRQDLPIGTRIHSLPALGSPDRISSIEKVRSHYRNLAIGDVFDSNLGKIAVTLGDFSVEELVNFEQMSGWGLDAIVRFKREGQRLSKAYTDKYFRDYSQGYQCEFFADGFRRAGRLNLGIVFHYSC